MEALRGFDFMDNRPIGVFDSGLGGLTAVRELRRILPGEDIIFFGDTGRVPYGSRSPHIIKEYAKQCMDFLEKQDVKMILVACGTVSSVLGEDIALSVGNGSVIAIFSLVHLQVNIKRSRNDTVACRCDGVGEPREGRPDEHGAAHQKRQHRQHQRALRASCLCHFFIFLLYRFLNDKRAY